MKVGYHGSHNATSKTLVEKVLPKGIPAMISTQEGEGSYRRNIPLTDLLTALSGRGSTMLGAIEAGRFRKASVRIRMRSGSISSCLVDRRTDPLDRRAGDPLNTAESARGGLRRDCRTNRYRYLFSGVRSSRRAP